MVLVRCTGFPVELEQRKAKMRWVRRQSLAYVDWPADKIVATKPKIVGCSSVFQQHCASLALLKRIHELDPEIILLTGVRWIQPGIEESLRQTSQAFRKRNSTLMNLQLLKWCCELDIDVSRNLHAAT